MCRAARRQRLPDDEAQPARGTTCFRGWWVLVGCVLIRLASAPGHSFGLVAFIDSFMTSLQVDRMTVSLSWLVASCASTVLTPLAGAGLDKFGVRLFGLAIAPLLFVSMCGLSMVTSAAELSLCLSAIRFLGPECLSIASGATYQRWFIRTRGRAAAIFGLNGLVLMSLPALFTALIESLGWRSAARALAVLLTAMLLVGTAMVHDTPQAVGLLPDGDPPTAASDSSQAKELEAAEEEAAEDSKGGDSSKLTTTMGSPGTDDSRDRNGGGDGGREDTHAPSSSSSSSSSLHEAPPLAVSTLRAAMRQPLLWCFCLLDTCFCFFWAGFNLTALDVIGTRSDALRALGTPRIAAAVFLPLSVCQNAVKLLVSLLLIDRLSSRQRALVTAASGLGVSAIAALSLLLRTEAQLLAWSVGYGAITGVYQGFMEVLHASLFGTAALGRIMGVQRAFATFSTGVGPLLFATSHDLLGGSYDAAIVLSAASTCVAALPTLLLAHATLPENHARTRYSDSLS